MRGDEMWHVVGLLIGQTNKDAWCEFEQNDLGQPTTASMFTLL